MALNTSDDAEGIVPSNRNAFELTISGQERMMVSCTSREERQRLFDLLQKQIRSPTAVSSPTSASFPYVSRPPFRLLTRYLARLIKKGQLTRRLLGEILDGGRAERERKLVLGCSLIDGIPPAGSSLASINDLGRFRRKCRVEYHLKAGKHRSHSSDKSSSATSSSNSAPCCPERIRRSSQSSQVRGGSLGTACLSSSSTDSSLFRTHSLPPVDLFVASVEPQSQPLLCGEKEDEQYSASTTVGAWISSCSFDSGLADVGSGGTASSCNASSPSSPPTYRSTLYAHWWRKAKIPSTLLASIPGRLLLLLLCFPPFFLFLFFFFFLGVSPAPFWH